jgi:predicted transcriptional regulator
LNEGLELFKALGSDVRIEILNILLENDNMSMNELASRLNITNGALTSHIKKLENCGLITTSSESAVHGNQKICSIHLDKILIDLEKPAEIENVYHTTAITLIFYGLHAVMLNMPFQILSRLPKKSHRSQFPQNLVPKHQAPTMTGLPISVFT